MQNAIKNLQFKVSPRSIDITNGRLEPTTLKMEFGGYQAGKFTLDLHLTMEEIEYLIGKDGSSNMMYDEYIITLEKAVREETPQEILARAANCAKSGFKDKAIELSVKALQKMAEAK